VNYPALLAQGSSHDEKKTWPWFNANCGDIDLCGFKKPQSYYRDVLWGISNIELAVHMPIPDGREEIVSFWGWPNEEQSWNWSGYEDVPLQVSVYSNYKEVSLVLNGREEARKEINESNKLTAIFNIPYESGEISAIGYKDGLPVDTVSLRTSGDPSQIRLIADRDTIDANRNDLSYVTVEILDKDGKRIPDAVIQLEFIISGDGEIAGVGNANPKDMKSFQSKVSSTFRGRCLVILRPTGEMGKIILTAKSKNLLEGNIQINIK
jgi:beta-galactosidase